MALMQAAAAPVLSYQMPSAELPLRCSSDLSLCSTHSQLSLTAGMFVVQGCKLQS